MRYKSLRILLMISVVKDYELVQMDVITAFLNADVEEDIYMKQPKGYENGSHLYCKLNKSLYGLVQAPHNWNGVLNNFILSVGFTRLKSDTCIYAKRSRTGELIMIGVFVDDMPVAYHKRDEHEWLEIKQLFMQRFRMKDLGECKLILGMRITRDRQKHTLHIDNQVHIEKLLDKFGMRQCKPANTPEEQMKLVPTASEEEEKVDKVMYQSMIGALNYLVQTCRPDIAHAVNTVSRHCTDPSHIHLVAVKRIMRYLRGTPHMGLTYTRRTTGAKPINMVVYTDSDWGGDSTDRKSTTGYVVKINGCTVSWGTKKQQTVALSTAEAEYMAISVGIQEVIWMRQFIGEILKVLNKALDEASTVYCDNQAAVSISTNDVHHHRTKHIDIKYHFIRDHVQNKVVKMEWLPTHEQVADILTKPLEKVKFMNCRMKLLQSTSANVNSGGVSK
jgi:hypothetical protein